MEQNNIGNTDCAAEAAQPASSDEAVAVIGDCFSIGWIGYGPIAPIVERPETMAFDEESNPQ